MDYQFLSHEEIEHMKGLLKVGPLDIPYIWIYYYDESREREEGIAFAPYEDRFIENMKKFNYTPTKEEIQDYPGIKFLSNEDMSKENLILFIEND